MVNVEGGMSRNSHPVNVRLIFRVGDIGRSIVPVFQSNPASMKIDETRILLMVLVQESC